MIGKPRKVVLPLMDAEKISFPCMTSMIGLMHNYLIVSDRFRPLKGPERFEFVLLSCKPRMWNNRVLFYPFAT